MLAKFILIRLSFLLIILFSGAFTSTLHAQQIIDTKAVGGPKDDNNGFEDPTKFFIASNDAMFLTCPKGVFESVNLGVSWTALTTSPTGDFCFGSDNTLYLAGATGVYSSTNFGTTWTNLNSQLPNGPFYSIIITTDGTLMTGSTSGIFRSTDGGVNWDHVAQKEIPFSSGAYLTTTLTGSVMAKNGNSFFRSTDDGNTWTKSVPLTIQIWPISEDNILRQSDNGLERSTDDGVSWQSLPGSPKGLQYDIAMDKAGNLFTFYGWQLYISKDGGSTWAVVGGIPGGGQELAFSQDNTLYFSKSSEGIWRTLTPLSGVSIENEQLAISLQWLPYDPDGQSISFNLQTNQYASLTLINVLGEEVMTLANREFGAGNHNMSLPTNLPSGAYICVLRTSDGVKILKVLL